MEIFDYTQNEKDALSIEVDSLSAKEVGKVNQAIVGIKKEFTSIRQENSLIWANNAILPILKDFAEVTSSVLQVDTDNPRILVATLKNTAGFDITESCKCMKLIFDLANHIGIDVENGQIALSLIFDCSDYIG